MSEMPSAVCSSADVGLIAYETSARQGLVLDEGVILEIVRPGTGDPVPEPKAGEVPEVGEVRESSEALSRSVLGLQRGDAELAAAPQEVQEAIAPLVPLVERATRNASVVLAHQKVLTQVGQALQAINRQSSELLQTS